MIKPMGRGKYSEVYEGVDTRKGEKIVIKILKPGNKNFSTKKFF